MRAASRFTDQHSQPWQDWTSTESLPILAAYTSHTPDSDWLATGPWPTMQRSFGRRGLVRAQWDKELPQRQVLGKIGSQFVVHYILFTHTIAWA